jgi:integrase
LPRGRASFYTAQGIGSIKRMVEKKSGVKFEIRTLRRTYGQLCLDRGVSIDAVSKSMGHSSTKTTETFYCRKSDAMVREEIDRAWSSINHSSKARKINSGKNDLIESKEYLSGYV